MLRVSLDRHHPGATSLVFQSSDGDWSALLAGDRLVLGAGTDAGAGTDPISVSDNQGGTWTLMDPDTGGDSGDQINPDAAMWAACFTSVVGATPPTSITVTFANSGPCRAFLHRWRAEAGETLQTPVAARMQNTGGSAVLGPNSPSVQIVGINRASLVFMGWHDNGGTVSTGPSGMGSAILGGTESSFSGYAYALEYSNDDSAQARQLTWSEAEQSGGFAVLMGAVAASASALALILQAFLNAFRRLG